MPPMEEVVPFVQQLAPTGRNVGHQPCAEVLAALGDRSCLCLSDLKSP
jgi:hypothetical protein